MIHRLVGLLIILASVSLYGSAQERAEIFNDTSFVNLVLSHHPVAKQASLQLRRGAYQLQYARGSFDPKVSASLLQKDFKDTRYYSIGNAQLKVPLWVGDIKMGLDQNNGDYLNPELSVPNSGLWYTGISIPVGRGMFIDERRASLKQAKLIRDATDSERLLMLNDLIRNSLDQYWNWVKSWNEFYVYRGYVDLASLRYRAVKASYELGDKPAIDTLEAYIQVQNRTMLRDQALLAYQKERLALSNYLWAEGIIPLELTDSVLPPRLVDLEDKPLDSQQEVEAMITGIDTLHPKLVLLRNKILQTEVKQRLAKEWLKPDLSIQYNVLTQPVDNNVLAGASLENYEWGVQFEMPVFLRKERAKVKLTDVMMNEQELTYDQVRLQQTNKVRAFYASEENLIGQVVLYRDAVQNYSRLLAGERQKFDTGESSLFLINSRENQLIQARLKLIELQTKYIMAEVGLHWASGTLVTN